MITFDKKYKLKSNWKDITLSDAVKLCAIEHIEGMFQRPLIDISEKERAALIQYMLILSNCPEKRLDQYTDLDLITLFDYIKQFILALYKMDIEAYNAQGLKAYNHNGVVYHMPEWLNINENVLAGFEEPAKNMFEAADLMKEISKMKGQGFGAMNLVCALFLKEQDKQGKVATEKEVSERAEKLKDLPMWVVWEVFFYIHFYFFNYLILSKQHFQVNHEAGNLRLTSGLIRLIKWLRLIWAYHWSKQKKQAFGSFTKL